MKVGVWELRSPGRSVRERGREGNGTVVVKLRGNVCIFLCDPKLLIWKLKEYFFVTSLNPGSVRQEQDVSGHSVLKVFLVTLKTTDFYKNYLMFSFHDFFLFFWVLSKSLHYITCVVLRLCFWVVCLSHYLPGLV